MAFGIIKYSLSIHSNLQVYYYILLTLIHCLYDVFDHRSPETGAGSRLPNKGGKGRIITQYQPHIMPNTYWYRLLISTVILYHRSLRALLESSAVVSGAWNTMQCLVTRISAGKNYSAALITNPVHVAWMDGYQGADHLPLVYLHFILSPIYFYTKA